MNLATNTRAPTQALLQSVHARFSDADSSVIDRVQRLLVKQAAAVADATAMATCEARGVESAAMLDALGLDVETLAAALLLPAFEQGVVDADSVEKGVGPTVLRILQGAGRILALKDLRRAAVEPSQADRLRRMLLTIAEDPRGVLVRLTDQICLLRASKRATEEVRRELGTESLEVFAPLANRLGVWQLKWELEDLAFRFLEPGTYHDIASRLEQRRADREGFIAEVIDTLRTELRRAGIAGEVSGRPKHIYSIWKKMRLKGSDIEGIFDVHGFRVLVNEIADCYAALGLVHTLWAPIAAEFDDYIAKPKANLYRSLHTAVVGPHGRTMEVQIRTRAMHHHADLGVAAHWRYKEGLQQRLDWSRRFLESTVQASGGPDLIERFRQVAFHDRIYVLTPQGRIIDLPAGATALDFAYAVHTDIGHRCRGAKVDGAIVPLTQPLAIGQQVEILTARIGAPSRDWLNPRLGYLKTDSARAKIRRWFKEQDREQHVTQGRVVLDRERRRLGLNEDVNLTVLARRFGLKQPEDLLAAVGSGNMTMVQLDQALAPAPAPAAPAEVLLTSAAQPPQAMLVQGISNLLTRVAHCCRPVPGEAIVGYITQGQGVTIHRRSCPNVARLTASRPQRIMEVAWGASGQSSPVQIELVADDRRGLLRDVSDALSNEKADIQAVNTASNAQTGTAVMTFQVLILDIAQLQRVLNRLTRVPGVRQLRRL